MTIHSLSSSSLHSLTAQNPDSCPHQSFTGYTGFSFINVSRFSPTPSPARTRSLSLTCRQSDYFDQQQRFTTSTPPNNNSSFSSQSPSRAGQFPPKYFVGHSIYKGKAALTVEPRAPEFIALDSGAFKLVKEGFVLLQFAPAAGVRLYDWSRKQARNTGTTFSFLRGQMMEVIIGTFYDDLRPKLKLLEVFSLSVTEIGSLVSLGARDSCEFFHDPFKGKSEEGQVRKVLKVEPLPDGSGHFFNLSVQNKLINLDESIYIPVTKAEFAVLNSAFNFILPYLLGWHAFANSIKPEDTNRGNNASSRYGGDVEWNR